MNLSVTLPESLRTTFGLRNFPGKVFCVDLDASYNDQIVVAVLGDGKPMHFLRESLTNVLGHVVPIRGNSFVFEPGLFHNAPSMRFGFVSQIWHWISTLEKQGKLKDVICADEKGDILDPPYDNSQIPHMVEENVEESSEPRWWMLMR